MTPEQLKQTVEKYNEERYGAGKHVLPSERFTKIKTKATNRIDLHIFMLIDSLVPDKRSIICCAAHDEFTLSVDLNQLAQAANKKQIIELLDCGLMFDFHEEKAYMMT